MRTNLAKAILQTSRYVDGMYRIPAKRAIEFHPSTAVYIDSSQRGASKRNLRIHNQRSVTCYESSKAFLLTYDGAGSCGTYRKLSKALYTRPTSAARPLSMLHTPMRRHNISKARERGCRATPQPITRFSFDAPPRRSILYFHPEVDPAKNALTEHIKSPVHGL